MKLDLFCACAVQDFAKDPVIICICIYYIYDIRLIFYSCSWVHEQTHGVSGTLKIEKIILHSIILSWVWKRIKNLVRFYFRKVVWSGEEFLTIFSKRLKFFIKPHPLSKLNVGKNKILNMSVALTIVLQKKTCNEGSVFL